MVRQRVYINFDESFDIQPTIQGTQVKREHDVYSRYFARQKIPLRSAAYSVAKVLNYQTTKALPAAVAVKLRLRHKLVRRWRRQS
jgi:hypothetical protein